ncbi:GH32 C-terminal domain-containing protein [Streptomyces sp. NPDC059262]|uniref:GH32 C-terminal domain-containing protein n=1 Tax=Streptomyces sp. NPDC059262 TaxID=3346797 RepID=UPI003683FF53
MSSHARWSTPGTGGFAIINLLHINLVMEAGSAAAFGLDVLRSPGDEERTCLFYDMEAAELGVGRTRSGKVSSAVPDLGTQKGPLALAEGKLTLEVLVDRSIIETYANGHRSITTRAYPSRTDSLGGDLR